MSNNFTYVKELESNDVHKDKLKIYTTKQKIIEIRQLNKILGECIKQLRELTEEDLK